MIEIAAIALVGGAIAAGVSLGTRYIEGYLRVDHSRMSANEPIVRPSHPSGEDWQDTQR